MRRLWKTLTAVNLIVLLTIVPILKVSAQGIAAPVITENNRLQAESETAVRESEGSAEAEQESEGAEQDSEIPEQPATAADAQLKPELARSAAAGLEIKALNKTADVGTQVLYEVVFQYFAAGDELQSETEMVLTLPGQIDNEQVFFVQPLEYLSICGVIPVYDETARTLSYHFDELQYSFQEKILLEIETKNGSSLEGQVLILSGTVSTDTDTEEREASVTLQAAPNVSLTNKLVGIVKNDGEQADSLLSPQPGNTAIFGVGISVNRFQAGSLNTQTDGVVTFTYLLPEGFTYLADSQSDYFKSYEDRILTWEFPAGLGADDDYYFFADLNITIKIEDTVKIYEALTTVAHVSIPFVNGSTGTVQRTATTVVVFDASDPGAINNGNVYASAIYSPSLSPKGAGSSPTANDNPTVLPGSLLTWKLSFNTMGMTTPSSNNNSYDFFAHMDEHLSLDSFYSGDFYFKPSPAYPGWTPYTDPFYISLSVWYTDSDQWEPLMENIAPSTTYTAAQAGIDQSRTIQSLWFHCHDGSGKYTFLQHPGELDKWFTIPPGIYSSGTRLYTLVDEDYVGEVKCSADVSYCGWDAAGYICAQYSNPDYMSDFGGSLISDAQRRYLAPKTAQVTNEPTGVTRYIRAEIGVGKSSSSILTEGRYQLQINVTNDESSLRAFPGPFTGYVVLPSGVGYTGQNGVDYAVEVVNTDDQKAGKTLLKITWPHTAIAINASITAKLPIEITSAAPYKLKFEYYGKIDETCEYEVADVLGAVYGTYTIKVEDTEDITGNGNISEELYYTSNEYMKTNVYGYYALIGAKSDGETDFSQTARTDSAAQLQVSVKNIKKSAISEMTLVCTLPTVGDNYLLEEAFRNSGFSANLTGPLALPEELASRFALTYSAAVSPDLNNTIDAEWLAAPEVADWEAVRSFRLVMKEHAAPVASDIEFTFPVVIDESTLPAEAKEQGAALMAHVTYAVALNDIVPMESSKATIIYQHEAEDSGPEEPGTGQPDPEEPGAGKPEPESPGSGGSGSGGFDAGGPGTDTDTSGTTNTIYLEEEEIPLSGLNMEGQGLPKTGDSGIFSLLCIVLAVISLAAVLTGRSKRHMT